MLQPTHENLKSISSHKLFVISNAGTVNIHPNPKFYKYYWWIFTADSKTEGDDFLTDDNKLCYAEYLNKIEHIKENNIPAMIYNRKYHRIDKNNPWNYEKLKSQKNIKFAPSFDEDTDPLTPNGHK